MKKALVPALTILLVLIVGVIGYILNSDPVSGDEAADDCDVSAYTMGVKWQQQSAEAMALQGQTYEMAARQLDKAVSKAPDGEDLAIMTDLDETAIDNSKLLARDIAKCHDFSGWDTWDDWEENGEPTMIPGALEFFEHADQLGVEANHTLLMQLGDTLHDFDGAFADASVDEQRKLVEKNRAKFGTVWIVLPNPTYGDWSESDLDAWDAPVRADD